MRFLIFFIFLLTSDAVSALTPEQYSVYNHLQNILHNASCPDGKIDTDPKIFTKQAETVELDILEYIERRADKFDTSLLMTALLYGREEEFYYLVKKVRNPIKQLSITTARGVAENVGDGWEDLKAIQRDKQKSVEKSEILARQNRVNTLLSFLYNKYGGSTEILNKLNLIYWAVFFENVWLVRALCSVGVRLDIPDARLGTAVDVALSMPHKHVILDHLIEAGADLSRTKFFNYVLVNADYAWGLAVLKTIDFLKRDFRKEAYVIANAFLTKYFGTHEFDHELDEAALAFISLVMTQLERSALNTLSEKIDELTKISGSMGPKKAQGLNREKVRQLIRTRKLSPDLHDVQLVDDDDDNDTQEPPMLTRRTDIRPCGKCDLDSVLDQSIKTILKILNEVTQMGSVPIIFQESGCTNMVTLLDQCRPWLDQHTGCPDHCALKIALKQFFELAIQAGFREIMAKRLIDGIPFEMGDGRHFFNELTRYLECIRLRTGIRVHTVSDEDLKHILRNTNRSRKTLEQMSSEEFDIAASYIRRHQGYIDAIEDLVCALQEVH